MGAPGLRAARARSGRSDARADRGRRADARAGRRCAAGRRARQTASRVSAGGGSNRQAPARGSARHQRRARTPPRIRPGDAAAAARAPSTKHSVSEFEARRFAPCRPVQAHSPTANRPGSEERPVEVGGDPAHHVVGGGRDRDRLARRVEARLAERLEDVGEAGLADGAQVEAARGRCRRAPSGRGPPAVTTSRGASSSVKRSPPASSRVAPSPRTASVISRPSYLVPGAARAVGWNWQSSRSASSAPAAWAITGPAPIAPHGFVVRAQSAAAPPVAKHRGRGAGSGRGR